ncbi:MAG: arginine deiminase-related protein [Reichenbachiella sp.]
MIELLIKDEAAPLVSVVLGVAESLGGIPDLEHTYDPKSRENILAGTFPDETDLIEEMNGLKRVLEKHGVKVYRPDVLTDTNQVYARDIGFVIGDVFVFPNIIADREHEKDGISTLMDKIDSSKIKRMPIGTHAEGGDVIPWKKYLYVGYSEEDDFNKYKVSRTNKGGVDFLTENFPKCEVIGLELKKSDTDPKENALHLDCCFQPIGQGQCIIFKGGFKNPKDYAMLVNEFGVENCIEIDKEEMYSMNSNVFSISPNVIVSEVGFERLNIELESRGFIVEQVKYSEVSKMEGLFRCSTLPLKRKY